MARFHALGMATKYKRPEYFKVLKERSKCLNFKTEDFGELHEKMLNKMKEEPDIVPYIDRCRAVIDENKDGKFYTALPAEPWSTIIHSDFWVNNIMFHRNANGHVDDVKFVDFQNYLFLSPLREMIFYLFSSTNDEVQENHVEELIDLYHETLLDVLERMGCDTRPFARDQFDAKLPSDAKTEFLHVCFMLKMLTLDTQETNMSYDKIENVIMFYQGNEASLRWLRNVVLYFVKQNWI